MGRGLASAERPRIDGRSTAIQPIVVMGVSGSGKTVVGRALADRLGVPFCEGDALHPAANIAKMRAGRPLDDADRAPWLDRVHAWLCEHAAGGVVACSALKRAYRDRLRSGLEPPPRFALLDPPGDVLVRRSAARADHFMPASLLDGQLATLERPTADECALSFTSDAPPESVVDDLVGRLDPGNVLQGARP